jgi:hypothetical protein
MHLVGSRGLSTGKWDLYCRGLLNDYRAGSLVIAGLSGSLMAWLLCRNYACTGTGRASSRSM